MKRLFPWLCIGVAVMAQAQPPAINLQDALVRARKYAGQIQTASGVLLSAKEDSLQTRAAKLPSVNATCGCVPACVHS